MSVMSGAFSMFSLRRVENMENDGKHLCQAAVGISEAATPIAVGIAACVVSSIYACVIQNP